MRANVKEQMVTREGSLPASAERRLKELGIELPAPPEPFGIYRGSCADRQPACGIWQTRKQRRLNPYRRPRSLRF